MAGAKNLQQSRFDFSKVSMSSLFQSEASKSFTILVWSGDYNEFSGGSICLHYLAHLIKCYGCQHVYVCGNNVPMWSKASRLDTNVNPWDNLDKSRTYVIYPEIVSGNPLHAEHIGRWFLNKGKNAIANMKINDSDDIWSFSGYTDDFLASEGIVGARLSVILTRLVEFYDGRSTDKLKRRSGVAYAIRKGNTRDAKQYIKSDWICVDNYELKGGYKYLKTVFSQVEVFVSFDPVTYLSTLASLAGCRSIVLSDLYRDGDDWRRATGNQYGIGYGFKDARYCDETRDLLVKNIRDNEINNRESLLSFIDTVAERIANISNFSTAERLVYIGNINMGEMSTFNWSSKAEDGSYFGELRILLGPKVLAKVSCRWIVRFVLKYKRFINGLFQN
jgi:hypothetical protein